MTAVSTAWDAVWHYFCSDHPAVSVWTVMLTAVFQIAVSGCRLTDVVLTSAQTAVNAADGSQAAAAALAA